MKLKSFFAFIPLLTLFFYSPVHAGDYFFQTIRCFSQNTLIISTIEKITQEKQNLFLSVKTNEVIFGEKIPDTFTLDASALMHGLPNTNVSDLTTGTIIVASVKKQNNTYTTQCGTTIIDSTDRQNLKIVKTDWGEEKIKYHICHT